MKAVLRKRDTAIGEQLLTFAVSDIKAADKMLENIALGDTVDLEAKRPTKKRSLSANAYYQVLKRKVCDALGIEETRYHNRNLAEVGVIRVKADGTPDYTLKPADYDWEAELNAHYKPLPNSRREITHNGKTTYWDGYVSVLGSSEYNSKQMATLIDHVIADAKELNIETLPEEELKRMIGEWKGGT